MIFLDALSQVLGAPYADPAHPPESFNCTALVAWLRHYAGLETPLCLPNDPWLALSALAQQRLIAETKRRFPWAQVDEPAEGDLVMCGTRPSAPTYHVGLWLQQGVAHAYSSILTGQGSVMLTGHGAFRHQYPHVEYWRLQ